MKPSHRNNPAILDDDDAWGVGPPPTTDVSYRKDSPKAPRVLLAWPTEKEPCFSLWWKLFNVFFAAFGRMMTEMPSTVSSDGVFF